MKKAVERGARLFTISERDTNLDILADAAFKVDPSHWADLLALLLSKEGKGHSAVFAGFRDEADAARAALAGPAYKAMIAGPEVLPADSKARYPAGPARDKAYPRLADRGGSSFHEPVGDGRNGGPAGDKTGRGAAQERP